MHTAILTYVALKSFVEAILTAANWKREEHDPLKTIDEDLFWLISLERAREMDESMNRREMAELVLSGMPPMDIANIEQWLEEFYTDLETFANETDKQQLYIEANTTLLEAKIKRHFGLIDDDQLDEAFNLWQEKNDELLGN